MSRRPCAHCQRLWSAKTLVTVGAAELCPVCYKQRRWGAEIVAVQRLHVGDGQDAGLPRRVPAVCNAPRPHLGG